MKERDAASDIARSETAGEGPSTVEQGEAAEVAKASSESSTDVAGSEPDGMEWLVGEPTITPSHLAAVFQDNEEWAAVMKDFTFDQPNSSPERSEVADRTDPPQLPAIGPPNDALLSLQPSPQLFPALSLQPPSTTAVVDTALSKQSHARKQLHPTGSNTSVQHTSDGLVTCSLGENNPIFSTPPIKTSATATAQAYNQPALAARQRGSKSHRPTLSACRGWAGGSKGDAVSRYRPVVRRSADGRIAVDNPYA